MWSLLSPQPLPCMGVAVGLMACHLRRDLMHHPSSWEAREAFGGGVDCGVHGSCRWCLNSTVSAGGWGWALGQGLASIRQGHTLVQNGLLAAPVPCAPVILCGPCRWMQGTPPHMDCMGLIDSSGMKAIRAIPSTFRDHPQSKASKGPWVQARMCGASPESRGKG